MKLTIAEILQKAHNAKTKSEKVKVLQENNSQALRSLFIWNYDDSVVSAIPDGDVPYRPNPAPMGTEHTLLEKEARKFYYFIKGGADNLPSMKKENMFIQNSSPQLREMKLRRFTSSWLLEILVLRT